MPNYRRYYLPNSIVFVTIVTAGRRRHLIQNINLLRQSIKESRYDFKIIAGVVMPDHMHLLIKPEDIRELPKIVFSIKYRYSRNFTGGVGTPPYNFQDLIHPNFSTVGRDTYPAGNQNRRKGEKGVWQSRYYDHVIRDEDDFNKHLDYIHYNPMKHLGVTPKDWEYSSFMRFVEDEYYDINWCNFEDKYKISEMDLE